MKKSGYFIMSVCWTLVAGYGNEAMASVMDNIYRAAVRNDVAALNSYLNQGYSIDTSDGSVTALCKARLKNERAAYNLLLAYGANPYADCMAISPSSGLSTTTYVVGAVGVAAVGGAIALAAGGGGGGGSSSADGKNKDDDSGDDNDKPSGQYDDDSGDNKQDNPDISGDDTPDGGDDDNTSDDGNGNQNDDGDDNGSSDNGSNDDSGGNGGNDSGSGNVSSYTSYTPYYFRNLKEFNGSNFNKYTYKGLTYTSVNYLGGINAAPAFAKFFGKDNNGKPVSKLAAYNTVGVIDTGVWGNHEEFKNNNGSSKVSGYNYDYGPCRESDNKNCWKFDSSSTLYKVDGTWLYSPSQMVFYGADGLATSQIEYDVSQDDYDAWAADYPSDYDWDKVKTTYTPLDGDDYLHGTNVAGLIAANWDGAHNMGVSFSNTDIKAVRWDIKSNLADPVKKLVDDDVVAINMSFGSKATSNKNASTVSSYKGRLISGYLSAAEYTMSRYKTTTNSGRTTKDGAIWVKAAGNNAYSQPDVESGIKLLSGYSDLMMLVVVSVDVKLSSNGLVESYKLSSFSNKCGAAASYCIAAPGGNEAGSVRDLLYGPATSENYIGMGGTSQAAPLVTGSIAFLKAAYQYITASEIIDLLRETANTNGSGYNSNTKADATYGAGLLDLGAAVTTYVSPSTTSSIITTVSGNSVNTPEVRLDNSLLTVTSSLSYALIKALPDTITVFDRYNRPFAVKTSHYVQATHSGYKNYKNDVIHMMQPQKIKSEQKNGLSFMYAANDNQLSFASAVSRSGNKTTGFYFSENTMYEVGKTIGKEAKNPFMSLTSAYGVYQERQIGTGKFFKLEAIAGRNGLYDGDNDFNDDTFKKSAYALNSEFKLYNTKNFVVSLSSGLLYEDDAMLGINGEGIFKVSGGETYNAGVAASWYITPKWSLNSSYYRGITPRQKFASGLIKTSRLISESFAIGANYQYDKSLDLGIILSSPLKVVKGDVEVDFPSGRDDYLDTVYRRQYKSSLKSEKREYKFEVYAIKEISSALNWSTKLGVRINPEHQSTENDYIALFGLNWNFN